MKKILLLTLVLTTYLNLSFSQCVDPVVELHFDDELMVTGETYNYCEGEELSIILSDVTIGQAPFEIEFEIDGIGYSASQIEIGDTLITTALAAGIQAVVFTSIMDDEGCDVDLVESIYEATLEVNQEPLTTMSINGDVIDDSETYSFCYDSDVVITLSDVVAGDAPFDITYEVEGNPMSAMGIGEGDEVYNDNPTAGTYGITITSATDANGCEVSDLPSFTLIIHPEPEVEMSINEEVLVNGETYTYCEGEMITVDLSGVTEGAAPFEVTYEIDGDVTTVVDVNENDDIYSETLDAGVYDFVVTSVMDAEGCEMTTLPSFTIVVNEEPNLTYTVNGETVLDGETYPFCYDSDIVLTLDAVVSGESPFDITMEVNGDEMNVTGAQLDDDFYSENLEAGTYSFEITNIMDANGCSSLSSTGFTVEVLPEPEVYFSVNETVVSTDDELSLCGGEVAITLSEIIEGGDMFDIEWTINGDADAVSGIEIGDTVNYEPALPEGSYDVIITSITDENGCTVINPELTYTFTIDIIDAPEVSLAFNGEVLGTEDTLSTCFEEALAIELIDVVSGTAPINFEWTVNGSFFSTNTVEINDTIYNEISEPGVHEIIFTSIMDANGCPIEDSELTYVFYIETPNPSANVSDDAICEGEDVTLLATGGDNYLWEDEDEESYMNEETITLNTSMMFYVTIQNTGCDDITDSVYVSVEPFPNPVISMNDNGVLLCTSLPGATYQWFYEGTPIPNSNSNVLFPDEDGEYSVIVTSSNDCEGTATYEYDSSTVSVFEHKGAPLTIFPNPNNGNFTIETSFRGTLRLVNQIGQLVETLHINAITNTVSINGLSNGVYFIIGQDDNGIIREKVVISK